jgi:hypothetical protein
LKKKKTKERGGGSLHLRARPFADFNGDVDGTPKAGQLGHWSEKLSLLSNKQLARIEHAQKLAKPDSDDAAGEADLVRVANPLFDLDNVSPLRVWSHCRFAPPLTRFIPDSLIYTTMRPNPRCCSGARRR